jgi:hypothetical protein
MIHNGLQWCTRPQASNDTSGFLPSINWL